MAMSVHKLNSRSRNACTETKWLRKLGATEDNIKNTEPFDENKDIHQVYTKTFWNLLPLRTIMTPVPTAVNLTKSNVYNSLNIDFK